ncbi:unnamed protein product [Sphagnum troendelagicum]
MQHHVLRFPPNMKWQRVPNDRNSSQTFVKTPGNIPDEETLQSKHIATAWIVTRVGILLVHMHTLGWGDGERDCSNREHCRGKNTRCHWKHLHGRFSQSRHFLQAKTVCSGVSGFLT